MVDVPVPYVSQRGNAPANDCGPACALMLVEWMGKRAAADTVEAWSRRIDAADNGTTTLDLAGMLRTFGLTPVTGASALWPAIVLVDYAALPVVNRSDKSGKTFGHWIVRLDATHYHDPYHLNIAGANLSAPATVIEAAMREGARRYASGAVQMIGIAQRPPETSQETTPTTTMSEQKTVKAQSWNVRTGPSTSAPIAGVLVKGDVVTVINSVRSDNATWYVIAAQAGGAQIKQPVNETGYVPLYMRSDGFAADAVKPTPQPTPTPTPSVAAAAPAALLGVHELSGQGKARKALELGARAVMCFEDALGAAQLSLAYPDAVVMHRKDFRFPLPARDLLGAHGINPDQVSNSRAWYRGANENDVATWDADVESIRRRAAFDIECATLLKKAAPNARWVAGGFAHGCPDFTDQRICDVIREVYAPAYNAGLIAFDIHTYSKSNPANPKDYRYYAPIWFERRWEFLFTRCGFDPRVRAIVSSETGGECGQGGFNWAGFTPDEFRAWCAYFLKISQQPLVVSGVSYPSPTVAATLFQWGNTHAGPGGWLGYALDNYIGVLQSAWMGQLPAEKALDDIDLYAGETPAFEVPAAKQLVVG